MLLSTTVTGADDAESAEACSLSDPSLSGSRVGGERIGGPGAELIGTSGGGAATRRGASGRWPDFADFVVGDDGVALGDEPLPDGEDLGDATEPLDRPGGGVNDLG